jgi:hypothetical protein
LKSRAAFGGLESPAVCQTGGDPGIAHGAERALGVRGSGSRLSKRFPSPE